MEKIQVELNKQSEYGVVYVVTLTPIDLECGGAIQDDKMRVYTDENKANERKTFIYINTINLIDHRNGKGN